MLSQIRQENGKQFSTFLKGVKMKFLPSKIWYKVFYFVSFPKYAIFAKFSKKLCFISFIDVWPLLRYPQSEFSL